MHALRANTGKIETREEVDEEKAADEEVGPVVIIGAGTAGLTATYLLAEAVFAPFPFA